MRHECLSDVSQIALALALDEDRPGLCSQPAEYRPAPDLGLGDKMHRIARDQQKRIRPRHMIGHYQGRTGRRCTSDMQAYAQSAQHQLRPALSDAAALPLSQPGEHECQCGESADYDCEKSQRTQRAHATGGKITGK